MKIQQLVSELPLFLTNEEKTFLSKYPKVKISSLQERDHWLAQTLVRKGAYSISKDNNTLVKK